ncbi:uncharacterized protein LOC122367372 isoform X3 [Amphibalanus amphitrite]|uniref:uncharacterized protein LOC122367372 isoform X3 n=1 Tax=Amphibalanus amphitrite TaxID=1232801 RepID=UPI001C928BF0|nr:uncharacterized protein LOC122367372 isoform X3 [Amphibalanus amphitrite]
MLPGPPPRRGRAALVRPADTMGWRGPVQLVLVLVLLLTLCDGATTNQPHIVFILADDLGYNDVSWHNPDILSPTLEALAREGVILEQNYAQPLCTPSRSALLSGRYPFHVGRQYGVLSPHMPTGLTINVTLLPERLRSAGYSTHMVGKWHQGNCAPEYLPHHRGFDTFLGYWCGQLEHYNHTVQDALDFWDGDRPLPELDGVYATSVFTDRAESIIKEHNASRPLFMYLSAQNPHAPLEVPSEYEELYPATMNADRRTYSAMVTALDDSVGRVVQALKDAGLYSNSVILFVTMTCRGTTPTSCPRRWRLWRERVSFWSRTTPSRSAVCTPSRSALLSGRYPFHVGRQDDVLRPHMPTGLTLNVTLLPERLRSAGYSTHMVGKWHQGNCAPEYLPHHRGFDTFLGFWCGQVDHYNHSVQGALDFWDGDRALPELEGVYATSVFTDRAESIIKEHDASRPLFLYLPFQNPHAPLEAPAEYEELYPATMNADRRTYSAMVTALDDSVGRVVKALKDAGLYSNSRWGQQLPLTRGEGHALGRRHPHAGLRPLPAAGAGRLRQPRADPHHRLDADAAAAGRSQRRRRPPGRLRPVAHAERRPAQRAHRDGLQHRREAAECSAAHRRHEAALGRQLRLQRLVPGAGGPAGLLRSRSGQRAAIGPLESRQSRRVPGLPVQRDGRPDRAPGPVVADAGDGAGDAGASAGAVEGASAGRRALPRPAWSPGGRGLDHRLV